MIITGLSKDYQRILSKIYQRCIKGLPKEFQKSINRLSKNYQMIFK